MLTTIVPFDIASALIVVAALLGDVTQRAIRRGPFASTADLVTKIDRFIRHHNANSVPFLGTA
jgi:hypothetical protein